MMDQCCTKISKPSSLSKADMRPVYLCVSLCSNCGLIGGTAQLRDLLVPGICNGLGAAFAGLYPGGLHL